MSGIADAPTVLVDGAPASRIPASDRGLQYGDGVFETVAVIDGRLALWPLHLDRLMEGCRRLGIPAPDPDVLADEARHLALGDGVLKIMVTRGEGGRGYAPPTKPIPCRILARHPAPAYPPRWWHEGVAVRVCATRLSRQPRLAGIKHLNRLEQVLARTEWDDPEIAEGLMLADNDGVIEGTVTNLFALHEAGLITPPLTDCGVAGVMRRRVVSLAAEMGLATTERSLPIDTLIGCKQLFLTNSLIGVWPVRALGDRRWPVGEPVRSLQRRLRAAGEAFIPELTEQGGDEDR